MLACNPACRRWRQEIPRTNQLARLDTAESSGCRERGHLKIQGGKQYEVTIPQPLASKCSYIHINMYSLTCGPTHEYAHTHRHTHTIQASPEVNTDSLYPSTASYLAFLNCHYVFFSFANSCYAKRCHLGQYSCLQFTDPQENDNFKLMIWSIK